MIAKKILADDRLKSIETKLSSFLMNVPFDVGYYVTPETVFLKKFDRLNPAYTKLLDVPISLFEMSSETVARIKRAMKDALWYPMLVERFEFEVVPDSEEVDALSETLDIGEAVEVASQKSIFKVHVIERANERANQLLLGDHDDPSLPLKVYTALKPISNLLDELKNAEPDDRWRLFVENTRPLYSTTPTGDVND